MSNITDYSVIAVVVMGGLAWWQQDTLKQHWQKLRPSSAPVATQTTVYTWTDKNGTVHYSNTPDNKNAKTSTVDTGKISRLEPLPQKETNKQENKLLLEEVREEMIQNRNKMQDAREKQLMQQIER
jgi:hypothetical protein